MREYNRIHQIIHGLIRDEGDAERGCTFFSIAGSYLLNKHYGIKLGSLASGSSSDHRQMIVHGGATPKRVGSMSSGG